MRRYHKQDISQAFMSYPQFDGKFFSVLIIRPDPWYTKFIYIIGWKLEKKTISTDCVMIIGVPSRVPNTLKNFSNPTHKK